jgi:hypothetical protein
MHPPLMLCLLFLFQRREGAQAPPVGMASLNEATSTTTTEATPGGGDNEGGTSRAASATNSPEKDLDTSFTATHVHKKRRLAREFRVKAAEDHRMIAALRSDADVHSLWNEYYHGTNGQEALRVLEGKGYQWRSWKGGKQRWDEKKVFYDWIESKKNELGSFPLAVTALQKMLDEVPRGKKEAFRPQLERPGAQNQGGKEFLGCYRSQFAGHQLRGRRGDCGA